MWARPRDCVLAHQINSVIEQTKIGDVQNRRISALSKGYKQRVGIAQALLGCPKVIILDEPTVGLDPIQIVEIRDLIRDLGLTHTVIFSSHILSEVQAICDQILMIDRGRLAAFGTPRELEQQFLSPNELVLATEMAEEELIGLLSGIEFISAAEMEPTAQGRITARVRTEHSDIYEVSRGIFCVFASKGVPLLELTLKKASLEDVFLELTDNGTGTDLDALPDGAEKTESEEDEHGSDIEA